MKIIHEHIIVKVPSIFIDETKYKGMNGLSIVMDVFDNPERHVRNFGEIVSVPTVLPRMPIAQDHVGLPSYHEHTQFTYKTTEDIRLELKIGDRVYFHHNAILPDMGRQMSNHFYLFSKKEPENGVGEPIVYHYFRVKYEICYASVRYEPANSAATPFRWSMESDLQPAQLPVLESDDLPQPKAIENSELYVHKLTGDTYRKVVTMIGSWCFVEPDFETWEDISIPTPETVGGKPLFGPDGKRKMKPKEQWMVVKSHPQEHYLRGWIRHVGSPLNGDTQEVKKGMYVFFRPKTNTPYKFEGKTYFRMIQRNVISWYPALSQLAS